MGDLALKGIDIRRWDLHMLLAAFESQLRANAKDEPAWQKMRRELYEVPKHLRTKPRAGVRGARRERPTGGLALGSAQALIAAAAASETMYQ